LYRRIGWEVLGQLPPLAAGGCNVEDRIYHLSPSACPLHADAREPRPTEEGARSQTTPHRSYRFHTACHRAYSAVE
jgi:hypothetical protein